VSESPAEPPRPSADSEQPEAGHDPSESDGASVADEAESSRESAETGLPSSLTFRITPVSLLVVFTVAVCVTPVAWARPWLLSLYLVPLLLLVWIVRVRTVVDADRITARTVLHSTGFPWEEIQSFRLDERRWLRAVLTSGKEVRLPAVRVRDLPRVAAMSGGRLSDPSAQRSPDSPPEDSDDAQQ
jgi:hypothetical protein